MALYNMKEVVEARDPSDLTPLLFRGQEDEFAFPEPATALLFTQDEAEKKATVNDILCLRGENAIMKILNEVLEINTVQLAVVKLSITKAEKLMYHPLIRLKEYPTLMSLDGILRLSGSDVSDRELLRDFFLRILNTKGDEPAHVFLKYFPDLNVSLGVTETEQRRLFYNKEEKLHPVMPDELAFWNVKEVVKTQLEVAEEIKGYGLKTEEDYRLLEQRIRDEFAAYVVMEKEKQPADSDDVEKPQEMKLTEEKMVPIDMNDLVAFKEELQIERKPRLQPPASPKVKKKKKKKGKKGKKGTKGKKGGKGKKGKNKKGKGKKGKKK